MRVCLGQVSPPFLERGSGPTCDDAMHDTKKGTTKAGQVESWCELLNKLILFSLGDWYVFLERQLFH